MPNLYVTCCPDDLDDAGHLGLEDLPRLAQLVHVADERDHDFRQRRASLGRDPRGSGQDRPRLHLHDVGHHQPEAHAAQAEHRVLLDHRLDGVQQLLLLGQLGLEAGPIRALAIGRRGGLALAPDQLHRARGVLLAEDPRQALLEGRGHPVGDRIGLATAGDLEDRAQPRDLGDQLLVAREELVERRVDEANDDREAVHGAEEAGEVIGLEALELAEGGIERLDRLAILRRALVIGPAPSRPWPHGR